MSSTTPSRAHWSRMKNTDTNLCLADDSDKAASNVSLYLMVGCVPKKIQHVFSESF